MKNWEKSIWRGKEARGKGRACISRQEEGGKGQGEEKTARRVVKGDTDLKKKKGGKGKPWRPENEKKEKKKSGTPISQNRESKGGIKTRKRWEGDALGGRRTFQFYREDRGKQRKRGLDFGKKGELGT